MYLDRLKYDWLIILEGINDIGGSRGTEGATKVADNLISAYKQMIDSAHAKGIRVYGATITPFGGSFYDSPDHETAAKIVNEWIRTSGEFDVVIDLDKALVILIIQCTSSLLLTLVITFTPVRRDTG